MNPYSLQVNPSSALRYTYTVYSRYITVGGVQAMVPPYKWERDISGDCHEPKSGSIFWHIVGDNGAFACFAANSALRQPIRWHLSKFDFVLQNRVVEFLNLSRLCINNQLEAMYFTEMFVLPAILCLPKIKL